MNDPNGLVRFGGRWHLFYQKSEIAPDYRIIGWGHAVSDDLLRWTDLGMAIPPDPDGHAYSGSVVPRDTSLLALFTRHDPATGRQTQHGATSDDDGTSWRADPGLLLDKGLTRFRDPFVVRWGDGWRMLVVKPIDWHDWRSGRSRIAVYASDDLADWRALGDLGPVGFEGEMFEVPVLLELPVPDEAPRWVLIVSILDRSGDGVSGRTIYWTGDFDGARFSPDAGPQLVDHGPDFYAATSFAGLPAGEAVVVGWLSSWAYGRRTPAGTPPGGTQSLPRRLALQRVADALRLVQQPAMPLDAVTGSRWGCCVAADRGSVTLPFRATAFVLRVTAADDAVEIRVRDGAAATTIVSADRSSGLLGLDRRGSGAVAFDAAFPGIWSASLMPGVPLDLIVVVDRCSVEIFAQGGLVALSAQIFPPPDHDGIVLRGAATVEVVAFDCD